MESSETSRSVIFLQHFLLHSDVREAVILGKQNTDIPFKFKLKTTNLHIFKSSFKIEAFPFKTFRY
jgi:hypothetical protein